ncbi:hypothetical protein HGRIS_003925 [Hohenbuehelia grisea]|uniref:Choline/carnitine acyltransferase domain-containing protein n=1 Tax=Hohenbuehelia grisea TaxID=104357 RepID=A0ABR3JIN5_9AGAR
MRILPVRVIPNTLHQMRYKSTAAPNGLPRLPVPNLRKTLDRYLTSIKPFLLEDAARGGQSFDEAYALRAQWADEFEQGIGSNCQEQLIDLDNRSPFNWLDDNIWLNKAYHEWREPLVVNSNWWLVFCHDDMIPESARQITQESLGAGAYTPWQIRRASWMAYRTLRYKETLAEPESEDLTRTGIWLRENVARMFNIARVPRPNCDELSTPPKSDTLASRSILVMASNWFYLVPVYEVEPQPVPETVPTEDSSKPRLTRISARQLERRIAAVVRDVQSRKSLGEIAVPVGILSADHRDTWAKNLEHLLSLTGHNQNVHTALQGTLFALSLDDTIHAIPPEHSSQRSAAQIELDSHVHSIRSTPSNIANRFFDKPYTIIVDPATRAGAIGEHSPVDALVPSIVGESSVVAGVDARKLDSIEYLEASLYGPPAEANRLHENSGGLRLDWKTDKYIQQECIAAAARATDILNNSDDSVLWFQEYGTDWMKNTAGLSPDAYIQQALQLAWYKTRGEFTATYETVLTRMFAHGRTETIRTLSTESRDFVLAMCNSQVDNPNRLLLLRRAVQKHVSLTREGATGRGIDRHILGLRTMLPSSEKPSLFSDELFERSQRWKLSTSGLSAGYLFRGTGFGSAYEDGYGINYLAAPDMIKFGIECKHSSPLTSTSRFQKALVDSLSEMHALAADHETPVMRSLL